MKKKRVWVVMAFIAISLLLVPMIATARGQETEKESTDKEAVDSQVTKTLADLELLPFRWEMLSNFVSLPLTQEQKTLTISTRDPSKFATSPREEKPMYQELDRRTNVKTVWETVIGVPEYVEYIMVKFAVGKDLPDIVTIMSSGLVNGNVVVGMYGTEGLIVPLEDLIAEHAPNITHFFEQRPDIKKMWTTPDGHIYGLSEMMPSVVWTQIFIQNETWLEKIGMNKPVTIDEWEEVLRAFRTNDLDGDGDPNNEYALAAWDVHTIPNFFGQAWGLRTLTSGGWSIDQDGKVQYDFIDPRWSELLEWMNRLYKEDILPQLLYSDSTKSTPDAWKDGWGQRWDATAVGISNSFQTGLSTYCLPPKGPYGDQFLEGRNPSGGSWFSITRDCEDPVLAIKWMDYIFSRDGNLLTVYGKEGKEDGTWRWKDGKAYGRPIFSNYFSEIDPVWDYGAWGAGGQGNFRLHPREYYEDRNGYVDNPEYRTTRHIETWDAVMAYVVPPFPLILPTPEEVDTLREYENDINAYKQEMLIKFISGQEPLENFDLYVKQIEKLGLAEIAKVKQAQWDRY